MSAFAQAACYYVDVKVGKTLEIKQLELLIVGIHFNFLCMIKFVHAPYRWQAQLFGEQKQKVYKENRNKTND